jgi:hypothetical protein
LEKVSRCASFGGFTYASKKYESWFRISVEFFVIIRNLNFFEILKFRQGGYWRFCEKLDFPKMSQFQNFVYIELFIIICNISVWGVVKFPIFWDSFIFTKFRKNEFFWKKFRVALVLEVSPMLLTNTRVNLQYPSSFSWFRVNWIFSKIWNFV